MSTDRTRPSFAILIAIGLSACLASRELPAQELSHEEKTTPSVRTYVYAKIILPINSPANGEHPAVESWIAKKLRKRGETEFRAVTNWVRLAEDGEKSADIWTARVDGKHWECVIEAVRQLEYVALRADFTHPSKEIEGFLRDLGGRPGEATIVVFHGTKDQAPIVLQTKNASNFVSTGELLDAMKPGGKAEQ